jgi:hypothetical protein
LRSPFSVAQHVVGAAAFSFGGGDEQVVAGDGEGAGIPLGGDEVRRIFGLGSNRPGVARPACTELLDFEHATASSDALAA